MPTLNTVGGAADRLRRCSDRPRGSMIGTIRASALAVSALVIAAAALSFDVGRSTGRVAAMQHAPVQCR
jgi:hypothetical protein